MTGRAVFRCGLFALWVLAGCAKTPPPSAIRFAEVTATSGLRFQHHAARTPRKYMPEIMGSGVVVFDADGDRDPDILCLDSGPVPGGGSSVPLGSLTLYINDGTGHFTEARPGTLPNIHPYALGGAAADIDGDGDVDIMLACLGCDVLLRQRSDGTFEDATALLGIHDDDYGHAVAFFDADGDGRVDIYVANYVTFSVARHQDCGDPSKGRVSYCHPDAWPAAKDRVWRQRADGTFEDATVALGFDDRDGKGLGVIVSDLDHDGVDEIFVANDSTPNFLWKRGPDGRYSDAALISGCAVNEDGRTEAGMGVAIGDVNGDGFDDLFITNLTQESNALHLGSATLDFDYASRTSGIYGISWKWVGFGCDFVDYDLDGDVDLHVVNGHVVDDPEQTGDIVPFAQPGQVLENDGRGHFREVRSEDLGGLGLPAVSRGSATLDANGDGRPDLVVSANDGPVRLFENRSEVAGNWIGLDLEGKPPNTSAIGASVRIRAGGREFRRSVRSGGSYGSCHEHRLHAGLGPVTDPVEVEVRWPQGSTESFTLPPGKYHRLRQR